MVSPPALLPRYRTIMALDIQRSSCHTDPAKARLRSAMYALLHEALQAGGITDRNHDPIIDRGDGALLLLRPLDHLPKTILLNQVIPSMVTALVAPPHENRLRLRVALHAGDVHYDQQGCFGESLDLTCRLLDARTVKNALDATPAPLVLVVSQQIYQTVVRHGYEGISPDEFQPLAQVRLANRRHRGWVHLPSPPPDQQGAPPP